ncbi:hypothetical protein [Moritella sp.]|uniref:hypothetical protein n=1 Tax=Moritella sp. TaxID=78556 RepID=UPI0025DA264B|nr:hypothetical protein [Moritella sp.]MCJ8352289.1 hypothetical protein [Moritella sp.]
MLCLLYRNNKFVDIRIEHGIYSAIKPCSELDSTGCDIIDGEGGLPSSSYMYI